MRMKLVITVFVIIKLIQLSILSLVPIKFDTSSDNYLQYHNLNNKVLNNFINWDNVYFTKLFNDQDLIFEHEFVFAPFYTKLINLIPRIEFYPRLVIAIIISNLSHLITCLVVVKLSDKLFQDPKRAKLSGIFCAISIAGVFLTTSYSESICALFTTSSLYLREISLNYNKDNYQITNNFKYFVSGILVAICFGIRSNSLLMGIIYLYDSFNFILTLQFKNSIKALSTGFIVFLSLCQSVGSAYLEFCPERGEWCYAPIPSLLYYAQSHYWNNGFLKYWTSNNIPNFLFMIPNFLILVRSVLYFANNKKLRPIVLVTVVYLFLNLFFWHVQIMNRISTFLPINYWYLSDLYFNNRTILNAIIFFNILWIVIQSGLFALFLPPA